MQEKLSGCLFCCIWIGGSPCLHDFLVQWNGIFLLAVLGKVSPIVVLTSESSPGYLRLWGVYWSTNGLILPGSAYVIS